MAIRGERWDRARYEDREGIKVFECGGWMESVSRSSRCDREESLREREGGLRT